MTDPRLDDILRNIPIYTDEADYRLLKLHPRAVTAAAAILAEVADPFLALIVDKDEVTLILRDELVSEFDGRLRDHVLSETVYRLITFDMELPPDLVGFMARIADTLVSEEISILPIAAFSRDHILVPVAQVTQAIEALKARQ